MEKGEDRYSIWFTMIVKNVPYGGEMKTKEQVYQKELTNFPLQWG